MAVAYFVHKLQKQNRRYRHQDISVKIETLVNLPSNCQEICRICLKKGTIPIFETNNQSNIAKYIQIYAEIKIKASDNFPKHLCDACYYLLQSTVIFVRTARKSDRLLRQGSSHMVIPDSPVNNQFSDDSVTEDLSAKSVSLNLFHCKICEISFETNRDYLAHKKSKQHKRVRIQCTVCHRLLMANLYKRHLARHKSETNLICEVCGKLFRKDNLIRHLQSHSLDLPYQCKLCPYRGRYADSLKIHMRSHLGVKPFSCKSCMLRFLTRSNLNRHLLTHKKEKPFKCHECERGFYTKRDLDIHSKSDHIGVKEFGCRLCNNKYGTKKSLMRHELRVHKRDKMAKGRLPLYLQAEYRKDTEAFK